MFGSFIEFKWNSYTKKLTLLQGSKSRRNTANILHNYPDENLMNDYLAQQWIKDYTLAACKYMLGEAREKFATIAGPQGGTSPTDKVQTKHSKKWKNLNKKLYNKSRCRIRLPNRIIFLTLQVFSYYNKHIIEEHL